MKNIIWAPCRMSYITTKKSSECIFCLKPKQKKDKHNYILSRGKYSYCILNLYPYNNGHIMIVPYRHIDCLTALSRAEMNEIWITAAKMETVLKKAMNAEGFNVGINIQKAGGAGIDQHLHVHIVPRWTGDTNFMPVVGKTKIIPEILDNTYKRILKTLKTNIKK